MAFLGLGYLAIYYDCPTSIGEIRDISIPIDANSWFIVNEIMERSKHSNLSVEMAMKDICQEIVGRNISTILATGFTSHNSDESWWLVPPRQIRGILVSKRTSTLKEILEQAINFEADNLEKMSTKWDEATYNFHVERLRKAYSFLATF